jgi:hypothetical protein
MFCEVRTGFLNIISMNVGLQKVEYNRSSLHLCHIFNQAKIYRRRYYTRVIRPKILTNSPTFSNKSSMLTSRQFSQILCEMEDRHMFSQLCVHFIQFVQGMLQKSEHYNIEDQGMG